MWGKGGGKDGGGGLNDCATLRKEEDAVLKIGIGCVGSNRVARQTSSCDVSQNISAAFLRLPNNNKKK